MSNISFKTVFATIAVGVAILVLADFVSTKWKQAAARKAAAAAGTGDASATA